MSSDLQCSAFACQAGRPATDLIPPRPIRRPKLPNGFVVCRGHVPALNVHCSAARSRSAIGLEEPCLQDSCLCVTELAFALLRTAGKTRGTVGVLVLGPSRALLVFAAPSFPASVASGGADQCVIGSRPVQDIVGLRRLPRRTASPPQALAPPARRQTPTPFAKRPGSLGNLPFTQHSSRSDISSPRPSKPMTRYSVRAIRLAAYWYAGASRFCAIAHLQSNALSERQTPHRSMTAIPPRSGPMPCSGKRSTRR